ncbi:MAG: hypothetical protein O7G85_09860 [Planctomycetota bacterium]|nr:hypothetical protein [Planctomycetota bacterium]
MKLFLSLCALCLVVSLGGCESDDADASMKVSPGAISECGVNCECCESSPNYVDKNASLGAVKDGSSCGSCPAAQSDASLGAVSEKSCSSSASSCSSKASLGAVSEKSCSSSASTCSSSKASTCSKTDG